MRTWGVPGMGERILVVDDSPWEREQLSALFALDGSA
jgi:hypothetical protein